MTACLIDRSQFDIVVHLGLGVYDCFDKILLEHGAINKRVQAKDAAGDHPLSENCTDDTAHAGILHPCSLSAVGRKLAVMDGHTSAAAAASGSRYKVQVAQARPKNTYICNF